MDKSTAMNLLKNTFIDYEMLDGRTVKLTLAFYLLKQLEGKNAILAERYYKTTQKKQNEMRDTDMVTILYTAYCCANMDDPEMIDEETFTILMGADRMSLNGLMNRLIGAKKKPASAARS